uniref:NADH-ubiquinone oxidoreductase chain 5 n=1 Tax=Platysternon megacephalum TaxID=55544 RepID=Q20FG5_9SAUR|nr:NADH dehydrogenase subunit 5 [Platysternon megacephalum]ABB22845.1 NADH dehydrogenase subunit 5 [Platysternon megacephalum]
MPTPPLLALTHFMTLAILLVPLVISMLTTKVWIIEKTKTSVKTAFFTSMLSFLLFKAESTPFMVMDYNLLSTSTFYVKLNFKFDLYSMLFTPVALYVSWCILEFSQWYMDKDPYPSKFAKYLLTFIMAMMILVSANNLLLFFIGWEGVGILSFLLIAWWRNRPNTNTSALQAIIYNRMGDIGLILCLAWLTTRLNTLALQKIFTCNDFITLLPLLGLILAAMGKSAQFGLHPWLPAAMEGPTPVSALLHSSTMVVAGIFLLIRMHPVLTLNKYALSACLLLGAITSLVAAFCALTQNDIKKIIAFSTSSQLGFMMVTVGLDQPQLAFLHLSLHAFFKAMLFLCSGSIIHNLNNEQDIRKMGGLHKCLPITSACLTIGSMALAGTPFLTGFYSKDIIIETMTTSHLNAFALLITLIATSFTVVYSLRITMFVQTGQPQHMSMLLLDEYNPLVINPIIRLATGSIAAGLIISMNITPLETPPMTMPTYIKTVTLMVVALSLLMALKLATMTNKMPPKSSHTHNFSNSLMYFNTMIHRSTPMITSTISEKYSTRMMDSTWQEKMGPKKLAESQVLPTKTTSSLQKGLIKIYLTSFILSVLLLIYLFD